MKKQEEIKCIGVCMDHAEAKLVDPDQSPSTVRVIQSPVKSRVRIDGESSDGIRLGKYRSTNNEFKKNIKKQNEIRTYFKQLAKALQPFDKIFIFGPTTAQIEFHNFLLEDKKFSEKIILSRHKNYMTENQIVAYVKKYLQ